MEVLARKDGYFISTDKSLLDTDMIFEFLSQQSYWSENIPRETLERSIKNSLCFGVYNNEEQVGFARVVSDYATVAYLGDVFIIPSSRKKGLSKWMLDTVMKHESLQGLRRWILLTRDAHELYRLSGWKPIAKPERWMEIHNPDVYKTHVN